MGKYKKIYVLAPFGAATGGIELAHQLVDYLRNKKQECFIVYIDKTFDRTSAIGKISCTSGSKIYDEWRKSIKNSLFQNQFYLCCQFWQK